MFKVFVFASLCAFVVARPGLAPITYTAPLSYGTHFTYGAAIAPIHPLTYSAHIAAPIAHLGYSAPVTYAAGGAIVDVKSEPVEYHGYKISY